jgi:hypothetical protein
MIHPSIERRSDVNGRSAKRPDVLTGKTIAILSPQLWGKMRISKHHYAIELARRGNHVYFINPPRQGGPWFARRDVQIATCHEAENLWTVEHCLGFPYELKFHLPRVFRAAMRLYTPTLLAALPRPIDIVWSFDLQRTFSLRDFPRRALKVFHPVDEPQTPDAIRAGDGASSVFSVTREILSRYAHLGAPRHFINHGLGEDFLSLIGQDPEPHNGVRVGLSGNFLRADLDRRVLLRIVREHPHVTFDLWGAYELRATNIGGQEDAASREFIQALKSCPNVMLHGSVSPAELATGYRKVDAFLICYDVERDQSHGTNYHKVMEFLAAGAPVVSNNITTYASRPDLIQMVSERTHNEALPALLSSVLDRLDEFNGPPARHVRQSFAADNTYPKQIDRIATLLAG